LAHESPCTGHCQSPSDQPISGPWAQMRCDSLWRIGRDLAVPRGCYLSSPAVWRARNWFVPPCRSGRKTGKQCSNAVEMPFFARTYDALNMCRSCLSYTHRALLFGCRPGKKKKKKIFKGKAFLGNMRNSFGLLGVVLSFFGFGRCSICSARRCDSAGWQKPRNLTYSRICDAL